MKGKNIAIEQFGLFEKTYTGIEVNELVDGTAIFKQNGTVIRTQLFYIADECFAVRFMPHLTGEWQYQIEIGGLHDQGSFTCEKSLHSHGRVVTKGDQFQYEDGSVYIPFGTTAYAWVNQTKELQDETIETLKSAPFNKIRMCVFPKSMPYNNNEPEYFPFEKDSEGQWNVHRIVPEFWNNLDHRIAQLAEIGVEADLIIFHPYDRWGFAELSQPDSIYYLKYIMTRYGAYHNIWWSLANEYEMLKAKTLENWDEYGACLHDNDPYHHLISIHQIVQVYPKRDWMTHMSIQSGNFNFIMFWKAQYQMPVIIDEFGYEGDLEYNWGNLSARELTFRIWWGLCRGGFCTHGETYHREDEVLWWAKGGKLYGESPKQIEFAKDIFYHLPGEYHETVSNIVDPNASKEASENGDARRFIQLVQNAKQNELWEVASNLTPMALEGEGFYLEFLGRNCPGIKRLTLSKNVKYTVEVIDIWEMTRNIVLNDVSGDIVIPLPNKEGQVVYAYSK